MLDVHRLEALNVENTYVPTRCSLSNICQCSPNSRFISMTMRVRWKSGIVSFLAPSGPSANYLLPFPYGQVHRKSTRLKAKARGLKHFVASKAL